MKQKVLITGASGFLGYHLINAAVANELEVYAAVRAKSTFNHLEELPVNKVVLDYADKNMLSAVLASHQFDYIIHAAGTTKANTQQEYDTVNALYTASLAEAAAKSNCKKFVFISSLAAVGPIKGLAGEITEDRLPNPVTAYGKSKLAAEQLLMRQPVNAVILRPTAIYGPREKDLFLLAGYLKKGIDLYIGNKPQKLTFVHGKDAATLAVQALLSNTTGIYNVSDGLVYSRYHFADIIKKQLNKKAVRLHLPVGFVKAALALVERINKMKDTVPPVSREKLGELIADNWSCNIDKAKKELNYQPFFNLDTGLQQTMQWYQQNKWI
jgi:UDP-glucose 4-epimerase